MKVARVKIENYRNLRSVDVPLGNLVALVGENNSGKSNFLRAIALPLSSDDGSSKSLSWYDINNDAKAEYYTFLKDQRDAIVDGSLDAEKLLENAPAVSVTIDLEGRELDLYDLKDLYTKNENNELIARIQYTWHVTDSRKLLELVRDLLGADGDIQAIKMSLLPMNLYRYEIAVPDGVGGRKVPYEVLFRFRHIMLPAERDNFAASADRLGSRALVSLFQGGLNPDAQKSIEEEYGHLVEIIRDKANLEKILNWQQYSDVPNAQEFFKEISVLPNMPPMSNILSGIRLGYGDDNIAFQGLGYRNLILMAVMLNAYLSDVRDVSLRVMSVEEPEAHLCINNVLLMASFFKVFGDKSSRAQIVYSTHDTEFVNKVGLEGVIVLHGGTASSLKEALGKKGLSYLAKSPNTDIFKLFFSRRLILVEGLTEELLIKAYLQTKPEFNDIKILAFHKGYADIIKIWKAVNERKSNRLGVVRDFDDQPNAQADHEALADDQVCVSTTEGYTLETDIVAAGNNHDLLVKKYGNEFGWASKTSEELGKGAKISSKADIMLTICRDLVAGELDGFAMPSHIQKVLDFLNKPIHVEPEAQEAHS